MVRDIRALTRTHYENPVVELDPAVGVDDIAHYAREARVHGLVLARSASDALLVLGRNDALGGLGIAAALKGTLRTASIDEFKGRRYEAI